MNWPIALVLVIVCLGWYVGFMWRRNAFSKREARVELVTKTIAAGVLAMLVLTEPDAGRVSAKVVMVALIAWGLDDLFRKRTSKGELVTKVVAAGVLAMLVLTEPDAGQVSIKVVMVALIAWGLNDLFRKTTSKLDNSLDQAASP